MGSFDKLFNKVDDSNKEDLFERIYTASKFLKIYSLITLILSIIMVVLSMGTFFVFGPFIGNIVDSTFDRHIPLGMSSLMVTLFSFILIIFMLVSLTASALAFWYSSKIKIESEARKISKLVVPYILIVLYSISLLRSLHSFSLIGFIIKLIPIYLLYIILSSTNKIKKLK